MNRISHIVLVGTFTAMVLGGGALCQAENGVIYRVEEDWEMVIHQPDAANYSPQVTFYTSPTDESEDIYFQLQMNYAAAKDFSGGGFHVAAVQDDQIIDEARSAHRGVLNTDGDRIRWTKVMASAEGVLMFAVKDGYGEEWQNFGGPEYLVRMIAPDVSGLAKYSPQQSLKTVDIGFGANRVASITLREVRKYYLDGRVDKIAVNQHPE